MNSRPLRQVLDRTLIAHETQSFDDVFRRYAPYVGKIALRILGREHEVDDVVQDVFLDAYRGIRELREPAAIKGWLSCITVRIATRKLRRRRLLVLLQLDDAPRYEFLADPGASPETQALLARVYRDLDTLPAADRVAWTLKYLGGEDLAAIAALTGASLATVKRRIARATDVLAGRTS